MDVVGLAFAGVGCVYMYAMMCILCFNMWRPQPVRCEWARNENGKLRGARGVHERVCAHEEGDLKGGKYRVFLHANVSLCGRLLHLYASCA